LGDIVAVEALIESTEIFQVAAGGIDGSVKVHPELQFMIRSLPESPATAR